MHNTTNAPNLINGRVINIQRSGKCLMNWQTRYLERLKSRLQFIHNHQISNTPRMENTEKYYLEQMILDIDQCLTIGRYDQSLIKEIMELFNHINHLYIETSLGVNRLDLCSDLDKCRSLLEVQQ